MGGRRRIISLALTAAFICAICAGAGAARAADSFADWGLQSSERHADAPSELDVFGRLVGDWDVEFRRYDAEGRVEISPGEWRFRWVLDGWAVQDVLYAPPRGPRGSDGEEPRVVGTGVRMYDSYAAGWRVVWVSGQYGMGIFKGRLEGDEIVMMGADNNDQPLRWAFEEITPETFLWTQRSMVEGRDKPMLTLEILGRRKTRN